MSLKACSGDIPLNGDVRIAATDGVVAVWEV